MLHVGDALARAPRQGRIDQSGWSIRSSVANSAAWGDINVCMGQYVVVLLLRPLRMCLSL